METLHSAVRTRTHTRVRSLTDSGYHGQLESSLGNSRGAGRREAPLVIPLLPQVREGTDGYTERDAQEGTPDLEGAETVPLAKNHPEGAVEQKAQAVQVAVVQGGEDDDGLGQQEPERPRQGHVEELVRRPALEGARLGVVGTPGALARGRGAAAEDGGVPRLAQGQRHDEPERPADAEQRPEDLAPAPVLGHERHGEEARGAAARRRPQVDGHGDAGLVVSPHVGDGAAKIGCA